MDADEGASGVPSPVAPLKSKRSLVEMGRRCSWNAVCAAGVIPNPNGVKELSGSIGVAKLGVGRKGHPSAVKLSWPGVRSGFGVTPEDRPGVTSDMPNTPGVSPEMPGAARCE